MTRIPLATPLKTRAGDTTKDARLKNAYAEVKGEQSVVRHRPSVIRGVITSVGVAQGGIGGFVINGDVLTSIAPSVWTNRPVGVAFDVGQGCGFSDGYYIFNDTTGAAKRTTDGGLTWSDFTLPIAITHNSQGYQENNYEVMMGRTIENAILKYPNSSQCHEIQMASMGHSASWVSVAVYGSAGIAVDSSAGVAALSLSGSSSTGTNVTSTAPANAAACFAFNNSFYIIDASLNLSQSVGLNTSLWYGAKNIGMTGLASQEKGILVKNGKVIIVQQDSSILVSNDGATFRRIALPTSTSSWYAIDYTGVYYIVLSSDGECAISSDLESWTEISVCSASTPATESTGYYGTSFFVADLFVSPTEIATLDLLKVTL